MEAHVACGDCGSEKPLSVILSDFKPRLTFFLKQQSIISFQNSQLVA